MYLSLPVTIQNGEKVRVGITIKPSYKQRTLYPFCMLLHRFHIG